MWSWLPPINSPIWSVLKEVIRVGSVIFVGVYFYDTIALDKDLKSLLVISITSGGLAGASQAVRRLRQDKPE